MAVIMERWLYIAACVLVPGLWGAACAWVFDRRDRDRARAKHAHDREAAAHRDSDG